MKKSFSAILFFVLAFAAKAQFQYITNSGAITITKYTGSGGAVVIPATINGLLVTSIGTNAFYNNISLTSVTIGINVTSIGGQAFADCTGMKGVTIGSGVTTIGEGAFLVCTKLTNITVAANNPAYSSVNGVLFDKAQATLIQFPAGLGGSYTIPVSVTNIAYAAFSSCYLTNVTISNAVTSIGDYAFNGCNSLTNITVAASNPNYSSVNGVLFDKTQTTLIQYPGGLRGSYTIPSSVTAIGVGAFEITSLTSVMIGTNVTSIGEWAFANCNSLTSATIPNSVTTIGDYAFYYCFSLTSVTIGSGVTTIGNNAFAYCSRLTSAYFGGNAPPDNGTVFKNDNAAMTVYYLPETTGWGSTFGSVPTVAVAGSLQVIISPGGAISGGAQWQVDGGTTQNSGVTVSNLTVGNHTVSFIAINNWITPGNQTVTVSRNLTTKATGIYGIYGPLSGSTNFLNWTNVNGAITITGYTGSVGAVVIPATINSYPVAVIAGHAFQACYGLTSVTIPNSVTSIGQQAFWNCLGLTKVTIPSSVTNIGDYAFEFCLALTSVYFEGNAPPDDGTIFLTDPATVYYLPGTTGWGSTFGGVLAMLWNPQAQTSDTSFGVQTNQFGFNITGSSTFVMGRRW